MLNLRRLRQSAAPEPRLDAETRAFYREMIALNDPESEIFEMLMAMNEGRRYTPARAMRYTLEQCEFCKGVHTTACPKVKQIEYTDNGRVRKVEFLPEGQYDASKIIWLEDVMYEDEEANGEEPQ